MPIYKTTSTPVGETVKRPRKILITTDLYLPSINGVVTSVCNLVEELEKDGYEIRILTTSYDTQYHHTGNVYYMRSVPCKVYPGVRMPVNFYRHHYLKELIDWKPDIVHSQCEFFSFQYAHKIAAETGAVLVHTYHTLYGQYASYLPLPMLQSVSDKGIAISSRLRLEDVNTVIAPTEKVKGALRQYGVKNNIAVIPTGISLAKFSHTVTEEEKQTLRRSLGISRDTKVLVSIGRLGREKNVEELIRFFKTLGERRDDVRLVIVGGGPDEGRLASVARELGLSQTVIFTGMVKPDEVRRYYAIGDVFVCASTSETQGLTYVEAMASGLPLVCRRDAALDGALLAGKNGYQYEDVREFCTYVNKIIDNPILKQTMRDTGRRQADLYSKEQFGKNVSALYKELYTKHRKKAR